VAGNLIEEFVEPIRALAEITIQYSAIARTFVGMSSSKAVAGYYDKYLFKGKTLQDFPAVGKGPLFLINSTSLQTGTLWRFSRYYMANYLVGVIKNPIFSVANAVAASSAFPPFLAPASFTVKPEDFSPETPAPALFKDPYNRNLVMVDGGVYDNLGLETIWKSCDAVFASDGGLKWDYDPKPSSWWGPLLYRVFTTEDNQIRSLRLRQLMYSYDNKLKDGAYWGIRTDFQSYTQGPALPCDLGRHEELEKVKTGLAYIAPDTQERLINLGYLECDCSVRSKGQLLWPAAGMTPATKFPYDCGI
jgi:NTE family protein